MKTNFLILTLLLMSAGTFAQTSADEVAVRKTIETETRAYHERTTRCYWPNGLINPTPSGNKPTYSQQARLF